MNYKERMHPQVSRAEELVFRELSRQGLTGAMVTQKPIVLRQTIPDFWWIQKRKVIYLDGEQAHREKQELDLEVQEQLECMGFQVLRIGYKPPLVAGSEQFKRVMELIREFVGGDGE